MKVYLKKDKVSNLLFERANSILIQEASFGFTDHMITCSTFLNIFRFLLGCFLIKLPFNFCIYVCIRRRGERTKKIQFFFYSLPFLSLSFLRRWISCGNHTHNNILRRLSLVIHSAHTLRRICFFLFKGKPWIKTTWNVKKVVRCIFFVFVLVICKEII